MNRTEERFDPSARVIPQDWVKQPGTGSSAVPARGPDTPHRWMSTVEAPLHRVRECAQAVFEEMDAAIAYLYETDDKIVIRCTRPRQQIRTELRPLEDEPGSTRIMVVVSLDAQVDRLASGRIVQAIEGKLQACSEA